VFPSIYPSAHYHKLDHPPVPLPIRHLLLRPPGAEQRFGKLQAEGRSPGFPRLITELEMLGCSATAIELEKTGVYLSNVSGGNKCYGFNALGARPSIPAMALRKNGSNFDAKEVRIRVEMLRGRIPFGEASCLGGNGHGWKANPRGSWACFLCSEPLCRFAMCAVCNVAFARTGRIGDAMSKHLRESGSNCLEILGGRASVTRAQFYELGPAAVGGGEGGPVSELQSRECGV
jgi:hypothetical protein